MFEYSGGIFIRFYFDMGLGPAVAAVAPVARRSGWLVDETWLCQRALAATEGMRETGERKVLGYDVGQAESYEFWREFLRHLVRRGLKAVQLVLSDAYESLKQVIAEILAGASWQRCRVHCVSRSMEALGLGEEGRLVA